MKNHREIFQMALKVMDEMLFDYDWYATKEAIKDALAEPEPAPPNFCDQCGKRLIDVHTCTPPQIYSR